jgi:two-component system sensor histidine kinase KdpD
MTGPSDPSPPTPAPATRRQWTGLLGSAGLVALAAGAGALGRPWLAAPDFVMLFLLAIGAAAASFGQGASLLASTLSVLAFNFFFVEPLYTLSVSDPRNLLTFAMMFGVGLLTSGLTLRLRRQAADAALREERTATLYELSRDLTTSLEQGQAAQVIADHAADYFQGPAAVFLLSAGGALEPGVRAGPPLELSPSDADAARWAFEHGRLAGLGTETLPEAKLACAPLLTSLMRESLGVLGVAPRQSLDVEQRRFLDAFARQAALALERARLAEQAKAAALQARTEQMRSTLLSAVSHDLRTPLAAITGAATTLRDGGEAISAEQRADLLEAVCEEAERLERLLRNLLDMTQLESGAL